MAKSSALLKLYSGDCVSLGGGSITVTVQYIFNSKIEVRVEVPGGMDIRRIARERRGRGNRPPPRIDECPPG